MTLEGRVRDEAVQVCVVPLRRSVGLPVGVVAQPAEKREGFLAVQRDWLDNIGEQRRAGLRLHEEVADRAIDPGPDLRDASVLGEGVPGVSPLRQ